MIHHALTLAAQLSAEALRAATRQQTVERSTTWLSAPARQGRRGNLGLDEEALAGGLQAHVPASPLEAEVWVEEALCQPLTRATSVNQTPAARTPNVTWELIDEGTQGLSALAREGTLVMPCAFA